MARVVGQPTLSQQARSLLGTTRSGLSLLRSQNTNMFGPQTDQYLGQALGGLGAISGGLGIYNAINDPYASDAQKAMRAGSGLLQGVQGASQLAGYGNIPYADFVGTGLAIGDIAADRNMSDTRKAYEATHQVGKAVANYFLPVVGGFAADFVKNARDSLFMDDVISGDYAEKRMREAQFLPGAANATLNYLRLASTPDDLGALGSLYSGGGLRPEFRDGRLHLGGHHLDTGRLDYDLNNAYQRQAGLIAGGPSPALLDVHRRSGLFNDALGTIYRAQTPNPGNASLADFVDPQRRYDFFVSPQGLEDDIVTRIEDWAQGYDRLLRDAGGNADAPAVRNSGMEIQRLLSAADILGLDLDAAGERLARGREEEQNAQDNASRSAGG